MVGKRKCHWPCPYFLCSQNPTEGGVSAWKQEGAMSYIAFLFWAFQLCSPQLHGSMVELSCFSHIWVPGQGLGRRIDGSVIWTVVISPRSIMGNMPTDHLPGSYPSPHTLSCAVLVNSWSITFYPFLAATPMINDFYILKTLPNICPNFEHCPKNFVR